MARSAFDQDPITLTPREAKKLLGLRALTDFLFIFRKILKWLRDLEKYASRLARASP